MDAREMFINVVRSTPDLPAGIAARAADAGGLECSTFDWSYIAFLDSQIRLNARGAEWTQRLARRRTGLAPYCGALLIRGSVRSATEEHVLYILAAHRAVVYWERYDLPAAEESAQEEHRDEP